MDSITQGFLGAAAAQAILKSRLPRGAGLIGAVGGVIPDLDIFIRSSTDPTVSWLFHRHFTHSLFFIPIGGLIAALPFLWLKPFRNHKRETILAAIIGYATHAPLDMFTSYGTQLFWPFSNYRVALDWIGIVDPIYTLMLVAGLLLTKRAGSPRPVRIALLLSTLYICFGGWQHHRAVEAQRELAAIRGHEVEKSRVMPAPGWLLYWRSTYIADGKLFSDGISAPWFRHALILEGDSADATTIDDLPENSQNNAEARRQFEILHWFADGYLAPIGGDPTAIGDMRITSTVEGLTPLWGLKFDPLGGNPARWAPGANIGRDYRRLLFGLITIDPRYRPLKTAPEARP